jgi:hypothetical protein
VFCPLLRNVPSEALPSNRLFRVYSLQREHVFNESLAGNELHLWLDSSGFQASCHKKNVLVFCHPQEPLGISLPLCWKVESKCFQFGAPWSWLWTRGHYCIHIYIYMCVAFVCDIANNRLIDFTSNTCESNVRSVFSFYFNPCESMPLVTCSTYI